MLRFGPKENPEIGLGLESVAAKIPEKINSEKNRIAADLLLFLEPNHEKIFMSSPDCSQIQIPAASGSINDTYISS